MDTTNFGGPGFGVPGFGGRGFGGRERKRREGRGGLRARHQKTKQQNPMVRFYLLVALVGERMEVLEK